MRTNLKLISSLIVVASLSACTSTPDANISSGSGNGASSATSGYGSSSTSGVSGGGSFSSLPLDAGSMSGAGAAGQVGSKTIYFDFDSYQVKSEFQPVIAAHASYLASHPTAKVLVAGHADERGAREYNIALGERRANAVTSLFMAAGASNSQIDSVSYGEESPVATCHDESCWSQNRRAVIGYSAR